MSVEIPQDESNKEKPFVEEFNILDCEPMEGDATHIGQMDLRVGYITNVYDHQGEEDLYIEEIELGSFDESRLFVSCAQFITIIYLYL